MWLLKYTDSVYDKPFGRQPFFEKSPGFYRLTNRREAEFMQ